MRKNTVRIVLPVRQTSYPKMHYRHVFVSKDGRPVLVRQRIVMVGKIQPAF